MSSSRSSLTWAAAASSASHTPSSFKSTATVLWTLNTRSMWSNLIPRSTLAPSAVTSLAFKQLVSISLTTRAPIPPQSVKSKSKLASLTRSRREFESWVMLLRPPRCRSRLMLERLARVRTSRKVRSTKRTSRAGRIPTQRRCCKSDHARPPTRRVLEPAASKPVDPSLAWWLLQVFRRSTLLICRTSRPRRPCLITFLARSAWEVCSRLILIGRPSRTFLTI